MMNHIGNGTKMMGSTGAGSGIVQIGLVEEGTSKMVLGMTTTGP